MSVTRIHNDQSINDVYFGQVDESKQKKHSAVSTVFRCLESLMKPPHSF